MAQKYKLLLVVFAFVVTADQVTKYLAVAHLTHAFEHHNKVTLRERVGAFFTLKNLDNEPFEVGKRDFRKPASVVVGRYWNHKYVENPGAAWGLFTTVEDRIRIPFFHVVSLVAILFIALFFARLETDQRLLAFALSMVMAGAVGNYIDRLARNYVVDFIDWHWRGNPRLHWPTFNVADAAICVGVALMLFETLFVRRPEEATPHTSPAAMTSAGDMGLASEDALSAGRTADATGASAGNAGRSSQAMAAVEADELRDFQAEEPELMLSGNEPTGGGSRES